MPIRLACAKCMTETWYLRQEDGVKYAVCTGCDHTEVLG